MGGAFAFLRPFLAPIIAPFLGSLLAWLQVKYHIIYTPEQVDQIQAGVITGILLIFSFAASLSGVVKVVMNKWLNKANASTTELTAKGNAEGAALKGRN